MKCAIGKFRKRSERQPQVHRPAIRTSRLQGNTTFWRNSARQFMNSEIFLGWEVTGGAVTSHGAVRRSMGIIAQGYAALLAR